MERLGEKLRKRREELTLTIKDIEAKTNIRAKYLEAIETGDYDLVPGEVFLKGFIRNYSEAVGFDSANILKQYHAEKNNVLEITAQLSGTTADVAPTKKEELEELINTLNNNMYVHDQAQANKNSRPSSKLDSYEKKSERKSSGVGKIVLILLVAVCAGSLVSYAIFGKPEWLHMDSKKKVVETPVVTMEPPSTPTSSSTTETKIMDNKPVETPKVPIVPTTPSKPVEPIKPETKASEPVAKPSEILTPSKTENTTETVKKATEQPKQPVKVVANVTESCWMNVVVDGKAVFTGIASPGENKVWVASEQVTIHLGNAAGVDLKVNDQVITKGKQGEVVTRTFNATK